VQIYSPTITVALRAKGTFSAIVSGRDALPRDLRQVRAMVMSRSSASGGKYAPTRPTSHVMNAYTIVGAAPDVVIGRSAAVRTGARPYQACDASSRSFQLLTDILEIDCRLLMPKPIARRKTKKAVAKRFKVTATGKVLRGQAGRRHLLASKNAKRKRQLAKTAVLDKTDEARIKENLPFN
jgi:large subunit ribosomal protein L35